MMKSKFAFGILCGTALTLGTLTGCGDSEPEVVEAPPVEAVEEEPAMEGMTDEEYNAAMEAEQGN